MAAERTGDRPIAVVPPAVLAASAGKSRTVRPFDGTAAKQRDHHPNLTPADYARVQRILDEGEPFRKRHRERNGFVEMECFRHRGLYGTAPRLSTMT